MTSATSLSRPIDSIARPPRRRGRGRGERGAVAVEFAIILPILIVLIFGMIEFGRAYNAKIALQGAVREGARVLAVDKDGDPEAATRAAAPSLDPGKLSVSTSGNPCTKGTNATVTADYDFEYDIPLFGSAALTLQSKGVMRCGG